MSIRIIADSVSVIKDALQTDEATAKLVISLLIGYPIALFYTLIVKYFPKNVKNLYILILGLLICWWNFGYATLHLLAGTSITFSLLSFRPVDMMSVLAIIFINLTYLFYGYFQFFNEPLVISWTTPYCILCLRLIGIAWDIFDGKKPKDKLSDYQKRVACREIPHVLEFFSFCFVPTAFIAGPQFPIKHYQMFISRVLRPTEIFTFRPWYQNLNHNKMIQRVFTRLAMASIYLFAYVKITPLVPIEFFKTKEFLEEKSLFYKLTYAAIFAKMCLIKYFICWLIGEGACVLLGLGCTGRVIVTELKGDDKNIEGRKNAVLSDANAGQFHHEINVKQLHEDVKTGKIKVREAEHNACANVSVMRFEFATNTDGLVSGHNINTNKWMLEYVYKRFRFLNNKYISQGFTLLFLAFWHGIYSGYYVCFFLEFITVIVEKDLLTLTRLSIHADKLYNTMIGKVLITIAGKIHVFYLLGSPLVAFNLLHHEFYLPYLKSVYFIPFIYMIWPIVRPLFAIVFKKKRKPKESISSKDESAKDSIVLKIVASKDSEDSKLRKRNVEFNEDYNNKTSDTEDNKTPLDLATKLRRHSTAAVNEWQIDCDQEERTYYESSDKGKAVMMNLSITEENEVVKNE